MKSSPRSTRSPSNSPTTVAFSVAPCRMPKIVLRPSSPMPKRGHHLLTFERRRVDQQRAQPHLVQPPLHHVLQFRPARLDEVFTDCALLQPVCFGELAHRLAV